MCGFAGFIEQDSSVTDPHSVLRSMGNAILHRGPDDGGEWFDDENGIGLTHRRLSILDLSSEGHQPMKSVGGRYIVVFNGEIYNHIQLRQKLMATDAISTWRGHSDTETLLAGFDFWGVQKTIELATGMFAFAVYDSTDNVLVLGRDRIGEKPLYYGWHGETFLFGSELKALERHPAFLSEINRDAITLLLRHNYIPAPYSIYKGICKLQPGCLMEVSFTKPDPKIWSYWSSTNAIQTGLQSPFVGTPDEAVERLEHLVIGVIDQQMIADVPIGAFLSGGVDSSTVVALMQTQSSKPVKTFSIGFHDNDYNEAKYAKAVSHHLGTEHNELYVMPEDAMEVIPKLSDLYSEPFSDSSQIPTYLVSKLAKQHVTVSLSGDAGDELFCGYNRYRITNNFWNKISMLPAPFRALIAKMIISISPQSWGNIIKFVPTSQNFTNIGEKLHKMAGILNNQSIEELYFDLVSHFRCPESIVIGGYEPPTLLTKNSPKLDGLDDVQRMMALDLLTYLPDDILVKLDRAAMGVSLETRVPFLDHRIVEFAWTLPQSIKLKNNETKWPLKQILYRHVPQKLIDRPKMGFGIPIDSWLRGPLRDWAENFLNEGRLRQEGFFYPNPILKMWKEHISGKCNWQHHLWNVLMFEAWLEQKNPN